jgi:predicted ATPase
MKIQKFTYHDQSRFWHLNMMTLNQLTLIVGASGVGKTQILKSIYSLKQITNGYSINGVQWEVEFLTNNDNTYVWKGKYEKLKTGSEEALTKDSNKDAPRIIYESLLKNGAEIINRNADIIMFNHAKTVRLPQEKSAIYLLKEEDEIASVYFHFQKIVFHNHWMANSFLPVDDIHLIMNRYKTIEDIQNSDESVKTRLFLASKISENVYKQIKSKFKAVFPYVEDIKIEPYVSKHSMSLQHILFIQIREKGIDHWIDERQISAGMLRTLYHISEIFLGTSGSVILIDEFENSLGINCIDDLTSELLINKRDLQFVITSHHPYIINNINYSNWKIVTRIAGNVTTRDAVDFHLGHSKHAAFTQLINLDAFCEGIEQ